MMLLMSSTHQPGRLNGDSPVFNAACAPELVQGKVDLSLIELLSASPSLVKALQDLKRCEEYMTPAEKLRVVELVEEAMKCKK